MGLIDLFWKGYYLVSDPNIIYKKGWKDAINENPRHYFKLTILFDQYKKTQEIYNNGYSDGLKEKIIQKM